MNKYLNKWLALIASSILMLAALNSCVKNRNDLAPDFTTLQDFVILNGSGLTNFNAAGFQVSSASADTQKFTIYVELASTTEPSSPLTVTLGVDDSKRTAYNSANSTNYVAFAPNMYKIVNPTVTIPAGQHYAQVNVQFFSRNGFDPAMSYMLPISIIDASGKNLSSNLNTVYYHVIGNPLAGLYNVVGTRYNYTGSIGYSCGAAYPGGYTTAVSPSPKTASAVDAKTIAIDYANLGTSGYQYLIQVDPSNPNNALVSANATLAANLPVITWCVHTYNPALKQFHIVSLYNNGAGGTGGSDRIIDETFTHQ